MPLLLEAFVESRIPLYRMEEMKQDKLKIIAQRFYASTGEDLIQALMCDKEGRENVARCVVKSDPQAVLAALRDSLLAYHRNRVEMDDK